MFTNLIKKIVDRDYLLFSQCFFDFTSGGEQNCKIQISSYDLNGNIQKEDIGEITNDAHFLLYGGYLLLWLAQMMENETGANRNDPAFWEKWGPIFDPLFTIGWKRNEAGKAVDDLNNYDLSNILSLFDQKTKTAVIESHAVVQFKIHKVYKALMVRVMNTPISQEIQCQKYLFVILFDFFCKNYTNAHKILGISCGVLMHHVFNKPFPVIAYKMMEVMLENPEEMSAMDEYELHSKVWEKIMNDKNKI